MAGRFVVAALVLAPLGLAPGTDAPAPSAPGRPVPLCRPFCIPVAAIQSELDAAVDAGVPGMVMFVRAGTKTVTFTAGVANVATGRPIRANDRFRIASITKTFVAALVVQLDQRALLDLDDSVASYLPQYGLDPAITIRQLLQHTSGLFDIADDEAWIAEVLEDPTRAWTPAELIRIGLAHPVYFAPGSAYHYSNTGYMLLGELVTRLTHHNISTELRQRIFGPLKLRHTYVSHRSTIHGAHARGYSLSPDGDIIDVTRLNATFTGAAGDIISTVGDVATFYRALLTGRIVDAPHLAEMLAFTDIDDDPDDGVGLGVFRFPESCEVDSVGHGGGIFGYSSEARNRTDGSVQDVAFANTDSIPEGAYAHLAAAEHLALCGATTNPGAPPSGG